jgi:hypothetical protein
MARKSLSHDLGVLRGHTIRREAPEIEDVADEKDRLSAATVKKIRQAAHVAAERAKVKVRNEDRPVGSAQCRVAHGSLHAAFADTDT